MSDFSVSFTPIVVPSAPVSASADQLANYQATFVNSIVISAMSLIRSSLGLKETSFYSIGDVPTLDHQFFNVDQGFITPTATARPAAPVIDFGAIAAKVDELAALAAPEAPALATPSSDVPTLEAVAPAITLPAKPDSDVGAMPTAAPSLEEPAPVDAPTVVIPAVPTLEELQLPSPPSFSLPDFTATAPQNLLSPPTAEFSYVDPGYASVLHDRLVLKLLSDLDNGSYGIEPRDEDALWGRARDRAAQQGRAGVQEAMRLAAATSLPMPPGFMFQVAQEAEDKAQQVLSEANRDIALRRSELYVEGRKFTFQQVQEYEKVRIDLYNATQERALNYAKAVVETAIAVYDSTVRNFTAQLEAYKTEASVFESRVRGELAKAEVFRAQVEAERARMEFNRAKLEAYKAQLDGIQTVVDLYKSRLEASNIFMRLQEGRLNVFRAQVAAFAERVKAKEAEFGIYRSSIQGEMAKLDVFKAQIEAHNAQLGSAEAKARIVLQSNESLLQAYRVATQQYASRLESFNRQITGRVEEARTRGAIYSAEVDSYRAFTSANLQGAAVAQKQHDQVLEWNKASLASKVAKVQHRLTQLMGDVELQKDVNKYGAEFMRSLLGAAASGINALGVKST